MIGLRSLLRFELWRLRGYWAQDLLAGAGIAAGVALVFAVIVSNSSINAGAREILVGVAGDAQLQLTARSGEGIPQRLVGDVRMLPGVDVAVPLLEQRITLRHGDHRSGVELIGLDASLAQLGGVSSSPLLAGLLVFPQLFLPTAVADALSLPARDGAGAATTAVTLEARGRAQQVPVSSVLDETVLGGLASGHVAGMELGRAQALTGLDGRVTRILVRARPGRQELARGGLLRLAGGRMDVGTLDDELALLRQASLPNDQATSLFAAIGVLVGLLLAYTAMLLTIPERRRLVGELRLAGISRARIAQLMLFPALLLGLLASGVAIGAGLLLLRSSAHDPPGYLAFAWPLGSGQHVGATVVIGSLLAGTLLSLLAAAQPLLDLRRGAARRTHEAGGEPGQSVDSRTRARAAAAGAALLAVATAVVLLAPATTVAAVAALAVATLLMLPLLFAGLLALVRRWPRRDRQSMALAAARGLQATTLRSLALAATAAIAIFGVTAMEGAHRNLLTGLYQDYREYIDSGDLWITQHGDDLALQPLDIDPQTLAAVAGVADVRPYQGGFADLGDRRVWLQARSPRDRVLIPPSQLLDGDLATAERRLRAGGWVSVSEHIARDERVAVGDRLTLPTPSGPRAWRVAAITTNLGWGPGAIVLNGDDYARAWETTVPTAIELDVAPGTSLPATQTAIRAALGPEVSAAVRVQSRNERAEDANAVARAGLTRLSQIALILLVAATLALAAALSTTIWQRRVFWSEARLQGFPPVRALRIVLIEAALILGAGCLAGALAGTYGQWLLGRWLQRSTGYPAPFSVSLPTTALTCVTLVAVALLLTAIPAQRAIRAPARLVLDPET
ncbi:FtsX-like permease family protein [Conexibacter sp. CPCC 206217]|uniref:FtsX-like permease family protein n=1 Tax=Conexibacter sp. CPCC 206217 TaxID=3064574 RepID=UPI00271691A6|nr:ABC transporter permease [Conexibacter sp. CPCC 206217]MDO8213607.1 ABC transporter permease [Conexibacter sp. CPCC 206217]